MAVDVLFLAGSSVFEVSGQTGTTKLADVRLGVSMVRSDLKERQNGERENVAVYALRGFSGVEPGEFGPAWPRTNATERRTPAA